MPGAGRLTSAADFHRTYEAGRRAATKAVVTHALATGERREARVGISAARGMRGAVERNRAKRRLREAIKPLREDLGAGVDVVFVATAQAIRVKFQDLVDSARASAARAGALND